MEFRDLLEGILTAWERMCIRAMTGKAGDEIGQLTDKQVEVVYRWKIGDVRFVAICGGERGGKSWLSALLFLMAMCPDEVVETQGGNKKKVYWLVGPDYAQSREEFEYIEQAARVMGWLADEPSKPRAKTVPWTMDFNWNDVTIETKSAVDVAKLASIVIHGALMCEAGQCIEEAWFKIRGRVAQERTWCFLSGTLEDAIPWWDELLESWSVSNRSNAFSVRIASYENTRVFPLGKDDPEYLSLIEDLPIDWVETRFEAKRATVSNLVIPDFDRDIHVAPLDVDPRYPVELAIDPATHTYCVWFLQKVGNAVRCLDCVYMKDVIVEEVIEVVTAHKLWPLVKGGCIDVAGAKRNAQDSQVTIWRRETGISLYAKSRSLEDSINAVRYFLSAGRVVFDCDISFASARVGRKRIAQGAMAEFELWQFRIHADGTLGPPESRHNCDAIKALAYWLQWKFPNNNLGRSRKKMKVGVKKQPWKSLRYAR